MKRRKWALGRNILRAERMSHPKKYIRYNYSFGNKLLQRNPSNNYGIVEKVDLNGWWQIAAK